VILGPENVVTVAQARIDLGPTLSGSLEARQRSVIVAEASGSVEAAPVELGQSVKKGQLLARIEARALDNAAQSARAGVEARQQALALAERQAERIERLVRAGALAEHELELARNDVAAQRAQLAQAQSGLVSAQRQLQGAVVTSPIDGVISQKSVHQGDVVTLGSPLFVIIDPSSMRLSASVPSESLAVLRVGAPVEFRVRGLGDQPFTGSIERVGPAADPVTRQIPLLISLPNSSGRLVAGLFAEGHVAAEQKNALVVPSAALSQAGAQTSVRRLKDGRVEVVPVSVGIEDPSRERVEITSGLSAGDQVLVGAARELEAGTPVRLEATAS
jgi:membrane fusion protein (multidrug efflux system)